jgi:serine O-acetyltransferase
MTFKQLFFCIRSDLFRYRRQGFSDFLIAYYKKPGFCFTFWMRLASFFLTKKILRPCFLIAEFQHHRLGIKYGICIPCDTPIGPGLYIGHHGGIVVNDEATIGANCNLSQGITIGMSVRGDRKGCPVLGDRVYVGPGAVIIGKINIGNDVAIGANCVVTKNVKDNSVVVGIPSKVISFNGSEGYINHTLE